MNRGEKIEYQINQIECCYDKLQRLNYKKRKHENRLARLVISWLYNHDRKVLKNLDRSPFGLFMDSASIKDDKVEARLWYCEKNEDGERSWVETYLIKISDLKL